MRLNALQSFEDHHHLLTLLLKVKESLATRLSEVHELGQLHIMLAKFELTGFERVLKRVRV